MHAPRIEWIVSGNPGEPAAMSAGIHAFGGYVPRLRLQRRVIAEANAWFNPALMALGRGERAIAGWDEDSITMAVEAARDCLGPAGGGHAGDQDDRGGRSKVAQIVLASTTLPFQDRQNAGVVAEALHLAGAVGTLDVAGSQRAGTSALIAACGMARGGGGPVLVASAEKRRTKAASPLELTTGDAAAALLVGEGDGVARLLGHATYSTDLVDHYRGQDERFDYVWEERWVRDEGFMKIVPEAVGRALRAARLEAGDIDHFCLPSPMRRVGPGVAKKLGLTEGSVRDNLQGTCGEAGAAHPLVMLAHVLESAAPGERILVVGFGQGCDALVFEATDALAAAKPERGVSGYLARRRPDTDYHRYLGVNDLVALEHGLRSESDKQTGLTTLYRNREMVLGLVGGKCSKCGTLQFPKSNVCVNPNCHAADTQEDHPFSEMRATIRSCTADRLTYSVAPPAYYGMVQFEEGGRAMIDFTDIDADAAPGVGEPMRMVFRVKDYDTRRGFRRYFWKATPVGERAAEDDGSGAKR